ncbi:SgcJ/EcaC family oxidoreductase [Nesterenkonia ebinurensis]|uniref:SgcJ/EcaC family oxidoreductase n=1 Tax=Nesterenkonia ebinurensis TaxID=2608252 RepID=UPI001CC5739B|nr:SgcJ/EcaC family oxidoreductase [Nesterenkonia ebinurensis]
MTSDALRPMKEPEEIADRFIQAWNRADAAALAALFAEDADFVNVVGLWWEDRGRIRQAHDYGFRKIFANSEMRVQRTKLRRLGESAAVVHIEWTLVGQSSQGSGEPGERRGVFSFVLQKDDAGWLAVSAHNTDRVPGAETHIAGGDGLAPASYQRIDPSQLS